MHVVIGSRLRALANCEAQHNGQGLDHVVGLGLVHINIVVSSGARESFVPVTVFICKSLWALRLEMLFKFSTLL